MKKLLNLDRNSWLTLVWCPLYTSGERASLFVRGLCEVSPFFHLCIGMKKAMCMNATATTVQGIRGQQGRVPYERRISGHVLGVR
jgi:hypothetical protein